MDIAMIRAQTAIQHIVMIMVEAALDDYIGSGLIVSRNSLGTWIRKDDHRYIAWICIEDDKLVVHAFNACQNLPSNWIKLPMEPIHKSSVELANPMAIESLVMVFQQLNRCWSQNEDGIL